MCNIWKLTWSSAWGYMQDVKMCGCSHTISRIRYTLRAPRRLSTKKIQNLLLLSFWHDGKHIMNNYSVIKCLAIRPHYTLRCRRVGWGCERGEKRKTFQNKLANRASYLIINRSDGSDLMGESSPWKNALSKSLHHNWCRLCLRSSSPSLLSMRHFQFK